jgi:hypothetical protein
VSLLVWLGIAGAVLVVTVVVIAIAAYPRDNSF